MEKAAAAKERAASAKVAKAKASAAQLNVGDTIIVNDGAFKGQRAKLASIQGSAPSAFAVIQIGGAFEVTPLSNVAPAR